MTATRVAVIGVGAHPDDSGDQAGYSMGYRHADGYRSIDRCEIVGCADVVEEYARSFADQYGLADDRAFDDHEEMLDALQPDLVSVCTPPKTHLPIVTDCASHEAVRAIHCEKPIAPTWGESEQLVAECERRDVQLTFNLQNRCRPSVRAAKEFVDGGEIGRLRRVEVSREDLLQTGIHNIDLANYLNADVGIEWVIGNVDYREKNVWYTDMYAEDQGLGLWEYENGVHGMAFTGVESDGVIDGHVRVLGSDGEIEIAFWGGSPLRIRRSESPGWEPIDLDEEEPAQTAALRDTVDALRDGRTPLLAAENALRATEIVFAVWESARRRGRVDLPLDVDDNPLESLVEGE